MQKILMAKATALWLIENTKLTFQQIASFCDMHVLQIETLANGEGGIVSIDPVILGQITQEEIYRCETDPSATLVMVNRVTASSKKKARYVSLANRKEIRNAILWIVRNYPEIKDVDIRDYAKFILKDGLIEEKRELLTCFKSKILLKNKIVTIS